MIRKKLCTGAPSIELKSSPDAFPSVGQPKRFTTRERQWGMAMPFPIPVDPRFSRRFSVLKSVSSDFASSASSVDQLAQHALLRVRLQIELHGVGREELAQGHAPSP